MSQKEVRSGLSLALCLSLLAACAPGTLDDTAEGVVDAGSDGFDSRCHGLECRIDHCTGEASTTLTGVVYIPSGQLPLYNATVYVPNAPVDPIPTGASCTRCDSGLSGRPIAQAITDSSGKFRITNVPSGTNIPLVIQAGKWRRQITVPNVTACSETLVPAELTHMPRNHREGDIPKIALTTGAADAIECLLRKLGIDDSEFTPEWLDGRVNLYGVDAGAISYVPELNGGVGFTPATFLWSDLERMKQYDIVVLSCEGVDKPVNKSVEARLNMRDYLDLGGRVFASHWHNYWVEFGADPLPSVAVFNHQSNPPDPLTAIVDDSFDKGKVFADWLVQVGASTERGKLQIQASRNTIESVNPNLAQRWIYAPDVSNVQYLSFNTPVGSDEKKQCGRMVLTDIHVSSSDDRSMGDISDSLHPFPTGCRTPMMTPQEQALIFMFFDLANCLQPMLG